MSSTVLLITQVYIPDPAAVGQYLHDASRALVAQGRRVVVLTPSRGYDDPRRRYRQREVIEGVEIVRLPFCAFGKNPIALRLIGGLSLVLQSMFLGLFVRELTHILVSTAPPMASLAALFIGFFRRVRIVFWVMDLNPDQLVATGKLREDSWIVRVADFFNRLILRRADNIVALDAFMARRLEQKVPLGHRLRIIPPWPYENQFALIEHTSNPFRKQNGLDGNFVIMYSGNITPVHPIDTLIDAILCMKESKNIIFLFIGAESPRKKLDDIARTKGIRNLRTLPYVPLDETRYSLSAADLHIVSMGNNMVGIVHPSKVYGIMSVGRPFLAFGPEESHIGDIAANESVCWRVDHGDVDGAVQALREACTLPSEVLRDMGDRARELVKERYSRKMLCSEFCRAFE